MPSQNFIRSRNLGSLPTQMRARNKAMGIRDRPISPGAPWQNAYAERLIAFRASAPII